MTTSNPLTGLKNIILPSQLETGPLALGWWIVIVVVSALLVVVGYLLWRYWRSGKQKRLALAEIKKFKDHPIHLDQLNKLLKRTALAYYPRAQVASLSGKAWFEFLNAQTRKNYFDEELINHFIQDLYRNSSPASKQQIAAACQWLKHARIHHWRRHG
ncbi:DUF4381 domain-containing protein [Celerinatantimonas diazotrophica]|uniref:Uncharacterized protein DUF4381 n=1 Tax=Celerinatantimonas diazotrophica TaxID=412034 RepID=A0A4R1KIF6_9GAMM|nr:DUF4381 domain-containing protein [Celerinatantimonas diazotrophica]TCK64020.1 uncharacterized protein DUF4381 [Celerinatantimonas diazotrophica]CAG9297111.1 hypothetical protein CEDIAZO_02279 [Celerinatantimonas diazotrophica]